MSAVNLKVEGKEERVKTVQGLCVENVSSKTLFCTVVF